LFIDWTELYNEVHFAVIREIFHNPGSTRFEVWSAIYGELPEKTPKKLISSNSSSEISALVE
jgi:hypothetical protein